MIDTLRFQIEFAYRTIMVNTAGLSHEDSLVHPHSGGNCLNWVMGHIISSRSPMLKILGEAPVWDEALLLRYDRGSEPITNAEGTVSLEKMLTDLEGSQASILRGLDRLTADKLSAKAPSGSDESAGSALAGLIFHESYHAGQVGLLRRVIGKEGAIK